MPKLPQHTPPAPTQWTEAREMLSPAIFYALIAAVVIAIFAIYFPALNFQFILDDHHFVNDPRIQSSGHLWDYFANYVWAQVSGGPASFYRPLFAVWLRINFIFNGMSSWGWHLLSIAKHGFATVVLVILVYKLLHDRAAALLAGALFAMHPAQTESVAWIAVPDPLMSSAILGCLFFYLVYVERSDAASQSSRGKSKRKLRREAREPSASSAVWWFMASVACCLAALFTKETAIVLPVVIFIVAFSFPRVALVTNKMDTSLPGGTTARFAFAFRESWPYLAVTLVYLLLRLNALSGRLGGVTQHLSFKTQLLSWPGMLWFYVKVIFWPVRPHAFADPNLVDTFSVRSVLLPLLGVSCVLAALAFIFAWGWRKAPQVVANNETKHVRQALLMGTLLLVLPLLLALNLNALDPGDFLHGRYTYLPLCGLMLLLATGWRLMNKGRLAVLAAAGTVAVVFSIFTVKQEGMWKDDLSVFTIAHQIAPNNAPITLDLTRAHVQQALSLDEEGRCDEAIPIFNLAIGHYPQDWFAWAGLGECLFKLNDLPGSEKSLRRASELSHEPRVREEWKMVRQKLGLPVSSSQ